MNIIDALITNRTGGYYNISDLNRVETAFEYLRDKMNNSYGFNLAIPTKTNWTNTDNVIHSDMERYRQNVAKIRDAIAMPVGTPPTPASMNKLTAKQANDIERILQDVEQMLNNIAHTWRHSGVNNSGQGGLIL